MFPKAMNSHLLELAVHTAGSFYCLEEKPLSEANGKAIVFLHGLGENRSGLNYLFRHLSRGLTTEGFAVYRFDLGGCGESGLPLSLDIWKEQLVSVENLLKKKYRQTHLIARGMSALLLPKTHFPIHIAIGPIVDHFFLEHYPSIPLEECQKDWIPKVEHSLSPARECFWTLLGVEAGCLGGFFISRKFLEEICQALHSIADEWAVIYAGKDCPLSMPPHADYLPDCHPLFFYQSDREILLKKIKAILRENQHEV